MPDCEYLEPSIRLIPRARQAATKEVSSNYLLAYGAVDQLWPGHSSALDGLEYRLS